MTENISTENLVEAAPKRRRTAIEGKRGTIFWVEPESLSFAQYGDPIYDPRSDEPPAAELVHNIIHFGVREPLLVTKRGDEKIVVAGRKRRNAAVEANVQLRKNGQDTRLVPIMVEKGDPEYLFALMVIENELRYQDTQLGRSRKVERYISELGKTEDEATLIFGVTKKTIQARRKLLQLVPEVQKAVDEGKVGLWAAVELHGLPEEEQLAKLQLMVAEDGLSVEKAKEIVEKPGAVARRKLAEAKKTLLDAAENYALAVEAKSGIGATKDVLLQAAIDFQKRLQKVEG